MAIVVDAPFQIRNGLGAVLEPPLLGLQIRVFFVFSPVYGVVNNILADVIQFFFIAYYVFVIIPLPQLTAGGVSDDVYLFGRNGLECSDQTG